MPVNKINARRWVSIELRVKSISYLSFNGDLDYFKEDILSTLYGVYTSMDKSFNNDKFYNELEKKVMSLNDDLSLLSLFDSTFLKFHIHFDIVTSPIHWCSYTQLDYKPRVESPESYWGSYEFFIEDYFALSGLSDSEMGFPLGDLWILFDDSSKASYMSAKNIYERASVCSSFVDEYKSPFSVGESFQDGNY